MTLSLSDNANPNYLAKVVKISNIRKHSNADRLQVTTIDDNNVITGLDAKEGSLYVYFPLESAINKDFLSWSNSFEDKILNKDQDVKGFFNHHGRVRAIRLRGERSEGYIVPIASINNWLNKTIIEEKDVNTEFDIIDGTCICKKYINTEALKKLNRAEKKQDKKVAKETKLIDNQFRFHIDTNHLGKYAYMINPNDYINITNKLHGTSFIVSKVLCKKKLNPIEKLLKFLGVNVVDTHYDLVYSSRKVIKNNVLENSNQNHYYGYDLWGDIAKELQEYLTEGLTLYGEAVGFTKDGGYIQKGYDYGCEPNKFKTYIYRITLTNYSGKVFEFSTRQVKEFCEKYGLNYVPEFYYGTAKDLFFEIRMDEHWNENFVQKIADEYLEKDCDLCVNEVPAEGICLRRDVAEIDVYKHKSFRFKQRETDLLDSGELDLETIESVSEEPTE